MQESDKVQCEDMKKKLTKEYFHRVRKLLQSKIHKGKCYLWYKYTGHLCVTLYTQRASLIGSETSKYLTMYGALHSRDGAARFYLHRKNSYMDSSSERQKE